MKFQCRDTMSVPDLDWSPILCVVSFRCSITNFQNVFIVRTEGEFWKKNLIFLIHCWERCRGDKDKRTLQVGSKDLNAHNKEFTFERSQTKFRRNYDKKVQHDERSFWCAVLFYVWPDFKSVIASTDRPRDVKGFCDWWRKSVFTAALRRCQGCNQGYKPSSWSLSLYLLVWSLWIV